MSADDRDQRTGADRVKERIARLWVEGSGERFGFVYEQFEVLMLEIGAFYHWGKDRDSCATEAEKAAFLGSIRVKELVLARACALGNERAWEVFLGDYRDTLYSAAYGITKQEAAGRELAESLYAELFGVSTRSGQRRAKLASYTGRGSLAGWLRSVLAQRHVDEYRKGRRFVSIEDQSAELFTAMPETVGIEVGSHLGMLADSIGVVLSGLAAEDRFLLNAYHLDGRSLADIGKLMGVHESTISRRLRRLGRQLRKLLLKQLQSSGLNRRAAEEALSSDVRDIDVNVRRFLQVAGQETFQEVQATSSLPAGEES